MTNDASGSQQESELIQCEGHSETVQDGCSLVAVAWCAQGDGQARSLAFSAAAAGRALEGAQSLRWSDGSAGFSSVRTLYAGRSGACGNGICEVLPFAFAALQEPCLPPHHPLQTILIFMMCSEHCCTDGQHCFCPPYPEPISSAGQARRSAWHCSCQEVWVLMRSMKKGPRQKEGAQPRRSLTMHSIWRAGWRKDSCWSAEWHMPTGLPNSTCCVPLH